MANNRFHSVSRRSFLKGSVAAGALIGLSAQRIEAIQAAAARTGIKSHSWTTLPLNNGQTVEAGAAELGGDLALERNSDGSFQPSRIFVSAVQPGQRLFNMVGMRWVAE